MLNLHIYHFWDSYQIKMDLLLLYLLQNIKYNLHVILINKNRYTIQILNNLKNMENKEQ